MQEPAVRKRRLLFYDWVRHEQMSVAPRFSGGIGGPKKLPPALAGFFGAKAPVLGLRPLAPSKAGGN